jgi:hypothetical protein
MKRGGSRARLGPRAMEELLKSSNLLAPGCKRGRNRAVLLRPERASAGSTEFLVRRVELIGERKSGLQPSRRKSGYRLKAPARCRITPPRSAPGLERPSSKRPSSIGTRVPPPSANLTSTQQEAVRFRSNGSNVFDFHIRAGDVRWLGRLFWKETTQGFAVPIFAIGAHALSYPGAGRYISRWFDVNKVGVSALTRPPGRLPGNGRSIHRLSFSTPKKDH